MFERLRSRLEFRGWLCNTTALCIGAGRSGEALGTDLPVVRDELGRPYIPGSSLKGVLRSYLESVVRAVLDSPRLACDPTDERAWCITPGRMREIRHKVESVRGSDEDLTRLVLESSCLICQTFGSPWLASKIMVSDLHVEEELWFGQFEVRNGVAIDRDTETAAEKKLYDYETMPAGARFNCRVVVENGEQWQWGMVILGLRALERGDLLLGGSKSRGLGWVTLKWETRRLFTVDEASAPEQRLASLIDLAEGRGFVDVSEQELSEYVKEFRRKLADAVGQVRG